MRVPIPKHLTLFNIQETAKALKIQQTEYQVRKQTTDSEIYGDEYADRINESQQKFFELAQEFNRLTPLVDYLKKMPFLDEQEVNIEELFCQYVDIHSSLTGIDAEEILMAYLDEGKVIIHCDFFTYVRHEDQAVVELLEAIKHKKLLPNHYG